jgi:uncharacterized protein
MGAENFARLAAEAAEAGFRQIVVTGGEPLMHRGRFALMDTCRHLRGGKTGVVLRTNLTDLGRPWGPFSEDEYTAMAASFDLVTVSVDGPEEVHDKRRGFHAFKNVIANLEAFNKAREKTPRPCSLNLACVMPLDDINGRNGDYMRSLGARLGAGQVRFRPLLPLGRASKLKEKAICESPLQYQAPAEILARGFTPLKTCGIGQNLFVKPDGAAYPCYAWCGEHTFLGNVFAGQPAGQSGGILALLGSPQFKRLGECTVDTIEKCRACGYRYLCGGACRAWGNQNALDLNHEPPDCNHLKKRAEQIIHYARNYILKEEQ